MHFVPISWANCIYNISWTFASEETIFLSFDKKDDWNWRKEKIENAAAELPIVCTTEMKRPLKQL